MVLFISYAVLGLLAGCIEAFSWRHVDELKSELTDNYVCIPGESPRIRASNLNDEHLFTFKEIAKCIRYTLEVEGNE